MGGASPRGPRHPSRPAGKQTGLRKHPAAVPVTGGSSIRLYGCEKDKVTVALDKLPMDWATKVEVCDLLSGCYFPWSTAAFAIGLHLGLSLSEKPSPRQES